MPVDISGQPFQKRRILPVFKGSRESGDLLQGCLVELCSHQVANGVICKGADLAMGPVYILQNAQAVSRRHDSQVFLHSAIPDLREIANLDFPGNQTHLNFNPQHDMVVVAHFVCFHTDKGWPDAVNRPVKTFRIHICQLLREDCLQLREVVLPEGAAASHNIFPQPGLRFVGSIADPANCVKVQQIGGQGCAGQFGVNALLVKGMPAFMEDAKEGHRQPVRVVARGDTHVLAGKGYFERVSGDIQTPAERS